jgi:hypothetical protein
MNHISYAGQKLKIIRYSDKLYRSDDKKQINNIGIYPGATYKFFALNPKNTESYITPETPIISKWQVKKGYTLNLINILDYETRINLAKIIGSNALDIAFPIRTRYSVEQPEYNSNSKQSLNSAFHIIKDNNNMNINITNNDPVYVGRFSNTNDNTNYNPDYEIMNSICDKGLADGYYMDPKGKFFHSEIALCRSGLNKLELIPTNNYTKTIKHLSKTLPAAPKKPSKSRLGYTLGGKHKSRGIRRTRRVKRARKLRR